MKKNSAKIQFSDERSYPIFINSELDDFGLDPYEFRIYARIARRAGKKSDCFESINEMAKGCRMSGGKVKKCLARLLDLNLVTRASVPGKSSHYKLTDPIHWKNLDPPSHQTTQVTRQPRPLEIHDPATKRPRSPDDPGREVITTWVATDPPPGSSGGHEVFPFKELPEVNPKEIKNSLSPKGSLSPIADEKQPNSRERETGASALSTAEQPTAITTTATAPPKQNQSLERSQTSNGQTQYSAAPPEIFELSQWADFQAPGNYAEFWESVLRRAQRFKNRPESPECAAETWIRKQGHLLWAEFQKVQSNGNGNGHHPQPIYHCEIECPNNLQWYMENPEIDLAEHIAKVESNWLRLDLKPNDDRWINWLQKVEPDLEPAYGPRNLPDWVLRKLADDLSKTPC